jgi:hypothetical protein
MLARCNRCSPLINGAKFNEGYSTLDSTFRTLHLFLPGCTYSYTHARAKNAHKSPLVHVNHRPVGKFIPSCRKARWPYSVPTTWRRYHETVVCVCHSPVANSPGMG